MKFFKKVMVTALIASMTVSMVACGSKKEETQNTTESKQEKVEYITEITKDNVENIVIEYKEVLSYYNDLKNNLKVIEDAKKNPDLESDAINTKDSIKNSLTLLSGTQTTYKPLVEAKKVLTKMYEVSITLADTVVSDKAKYEEKDKEYQELFNEFKSMMDQIRSDVEKVRGKSPTEDATLPEDQDSNKSEDDKSDKNKDDKNDSKDEKDSDKDKKSDISSTKQDKKKEEKENHKSDSDKTHKQPEKTEITESSKEFVPKVSSLNSSLRGEIKSAGFSAGASYKQDGGDASNLAQVASQMFNDIEGDNPINPSNLSEARQIFINAFISAYNSN